MHGVQSILDGPPGSVTVVAQRAGGSVLVVSLTRRALDDVTPASAGGQADRDGRADDAASASTTDSLYPLRSDSAATRRRVSRAVRRHTLHIGAVPRKFEGQLNFALHTAHARSGFVPSGAWCIAAMTAPGAAAPPAPPPPLAGAEDEGAEGLG